MRGFKEAPLAQASYIVRSDVPGLPIGASQASIDAGIANARAHNLDIKVLGSVIDVDPTLYLADYFNADVTLRGGDLLRDLGKQIILTYKGAIFMRARLVTKVHGKYTEGANLDNTPFYVSIFESYGAGGLNSTADVFVTRIS